MINITVSQTASYIYIQGVRIVLECDSFSGRQAVCFRLMALQNPSSANEPSPDHDDQTQVSIHEFLGMGSKVLVSANHKRILVGLTLDCRQFEGSYTFNLFSYHWLPCGYEDSSTGHKMLDAGLSLEVQGDLAKILSKTHRDRAIV